MPHTPRIGLQIGSGAPAWVQVREVLWQRAARLPVELVEVNIEWSGFRSLNEQAEAVEDITVQALDALIANALTPYLLTSLLDAHLPIIYLVETAVSHPRLIAHAGHYDADYRMGRLLTERLAGGAVLVASGVMTNDEGSRSRPAGFYAALSAGRYALHEVPTDWTYDDGLQRVTAYLNTHPGLVLDAIFGLSDQLTLAARDAGQALHRLHPGTLTLGFNGDPLALAAIITGSMTATMETDLDAMADQVLDLAYRAARGARLPPHFQTQQRIITADNASAAAARRLISLANLPTRLAAVTQRNEQQRVVQLETSLAIDRQVGLILNEQQLSLAISALIRDNYGFDQAQFLIWHQAADRLVSVSAAQRADPEGAATLPVDPAGPLAYALTQDHLVFIPDVRTSPRFAPDSAWPETSARVVVPVHVGGQLVGLLDLHQHQTAHYTREVLDGLQILADQLGIAMRNAEEYSRALAARATAEKADRLKTVLLANVGHELRTPLNVILGYSRAVLDTVANGATPPADRLRQDLTQIYGSGEHLLRLINDLLDLSRAEIDELDLLPERIETDRFLADVFRAGSEHFAAGSAVTWHLALADLPPIMADPVRLRQVLLNLLHNAAKFTPQGQITLGAEVVASELHVWVADTGRGIPNDLQDQIFEPFISLDSGPRQQEGIGLGLSIARRLVALHGGRLTLASVPGQGSTFHVYLPWRMPDETAARIASGSPRALLVLTASEPPPADLIQLAERRGLVLHRLRPDDDLSRVLETTNPAALAWDLTVTAAGDGRIVQQIQAHAQLNQLPLILYHPQPGTAAPAIAGIATGLVQKPLSDHTLREAIDDLSLRAAEGHILIVEDDPQTRALHRRVIAEHFPGYQIQEVGDGGAALALLAEETPSLVVLDLGLPEVDGFGVLEALRANPRTATVPVLVLSGRTLSTDDIRRLAEARVIFQSKEVLSEDELAASLLRTLARDALLPPLTSVLVKRALAFLQQHHSEPLSLTEIADALGVSKHYLDRIFQRELGLSPWEYLTRYRVLRAKELLRTTSYTVAEVGARVGFDTASYFSRIFHREVGCSPRAFREQIAG